MKTLITLFVSLMLPLAAQTTHCISGQAVRGFGNHPIPNCEVECIDSFGQRHCVQTDQEGHFIFRSIPLGLAKARMIPPKHFPYGRALTIELKPPFSDCTRDIILETLSFFAETDDGVYSASPTRFASRLPPGVSHFHPNADPQFMFE